MKTVGNGFHKTSKLVWRNKGVNRQPCSNPSPYFQFLEGCWWGHGEVHANSGAGSSPSTTGS